MEGKMEGILVGYVTISASEYAELVGTRKACEILERVTNDSHYFVGREEIAEIMGFCLLPEKEEK